jgi:predicted AAA+ superfamily ATPase
MLFLITFFILFLSKRGAKIEVILLPAKLFHLIFQRKYDYPLFHYIFSYLYPLFHDNMFYRTIHNDLGEWLKNSASRPMLIQGAPETGKTALLKALIPQINSHLYYNMEDPADKAAFQLAKSPGELREALFFLRGLSPDVKKTLIFVDEVRHLPGGLNTLHALHDPSKGCHMLATTSWNNSEPSGMADNDSWEKRTLFPLSFYEFLKAMNDDSVLDAFSQVPVPTSGHDKLLRSFHLYTLVGGMPGVVAEYAAGRHLGSLKHVYEHILASFLKSSGDIPTGKKNLDLLQSIIQNAFPYAATRIRFNGFGNASSKSRETGTAFRLLEKGYFLELVYPTIASNPPVIPETAKAPRLQLLDTGLVNYFSGIQKTLYQAADMNLIFRGQIARQVVGQEIRSSAGGNKLSFWVRAKAQSSAEVDFVLPYGEILVPVMVRSGEPGRLRSLHQFVDHAPHPFAVRLHAGNLAINQSRTLGGKKYFLLNLPYYSASRITEHLEGFIRFVDATAKP